MGLGQLARVTWASGCAACVGETERLPVLSNGHAHDCNQAHARAVLQLQAWSLQHANENAHPVDRLHLQAQTLG